MKHGRRIFSRDPTEQSEDKVDHTTSTEPLDWNIQKRKQESFEEYQKIKETKRKRIVKSLGYEFRIVQERHYYSTSRMAIIYGQNR